MKKWHINILHSLFKTDLSFSTPLKHVFCNKNIVAILKIRTFYHEEIAIKKVSTKIIKNA